MARGKAKVNSKPSTPTKRLALSTDDPWELVWGQPYIDAERLAAAIEADLAKTPSPDFRTRLLVRDSVRALKAYWGTKRFSHWLAGSPEAERIRAISVEKLGRTGYHSIKERLVATVSRDRLERILEMLGSKIHNHIEINIAGSIPTILQGLSSRPTDDIDLVNEVPAEIRNQREELRTIRDKFGLTIGHVQSHYLPARWQERRKYLGEFGGLRVYLVDVYDVFVSKLSSAQEKHKDDLLVMAPQLDKEKVRDRLMTDGRPFLENPFDGPKIQSNWQFAFREPLTPGG